VTGAAAPGRDRRAAAAIGRHARLELVFGYRHGRTVLTRAYAEPPFKVGRPVDVGSTASLILVCAAPGVFPGDELRQTVRVEAGAHVALRSQSALQAHPGAGLAARLEARYEVAAEAELACVWDPLIPFPEARIAQRIEIALTPQSRLYWSDAMLTGRCARGEAWVHTLLDHELRVSSDGVLEYLERYRLEPFSPWRNGNDPAFYPHSRQFGTAGHDAQVRTALASRAREVTARWAAGAASHLSTILVHDPAPASVTAEKLQHRVDAIEREDVQAAFDTIAPHLIVGRLLASRGPAFAAARLAIEAAVRMGWEEWIGL